jgi:hypothetical protein
LVYYGSNPDPCVRGVLCYIIYHINKRSQLVSAHWNKRIFQQIATTIILHHDRFYTMNLKEARAKNKLAQFIREREKDTPPGNLRRFKRVLKSIVSGTAKPKRGTSRKGSRAS